MRILIVRVSALGDAIHTLPALDLLKKYLPNARIDWLVQHKNLGIIKQVPGIDKIYKLHDHYLHPRHLRHTLALLQMLRREAYDLIIDFQGLAKTSILIVALEKRSIGFGWQAAREKISSIIHTHVINPAATTPIIEKNKALACAAIHLLTQQSLPAQPTQLPLASAPISTPKAEKEVNEWVAAHEAKRLILLAPNTTWESKHWPLARWEELVTKLSLFPNHHIVLLGQHFGDQGKQLARLIKEHQLPIFIAPAWSLDELFAVMRHADLIVAPDTGLLHIADCLGVATIGLYGPTKVARHGPQITPTNRALCFQVNCLHHYQKTHCNVLNYSLAQDCMYKLSANAVLERITSVISSITKDKRHEITASTPVFAF